MLHGGQTTLGWLLRYALGAFILIALIKGLWLAFLILQSEMYPAHHGWDGAIYTAVGRGILNGLTPYADLFETKPPGMFLLSALSLWLSGDIRIGNILQGLAETLLIATLFLPLLRFPDTFSRRDKWLFMGVTLLFGILLMAYTVERAGHFQSESFGAFFIALYGGLTLITRNTHSLRYMLAASVCLAFAIGVKEPFVFIALSTAILTTSRWKGLLHTFLFPLIITIVLGSVLMMVLGYFMPYFSIYLPEMLNGRAGYFTVPVWYYIFLFNYPLTDIVRFSIPLAASVVFLWFSDLTLTARAWGFPRKAALLLSVIGLFTGLIVSLGALVRMYAGQPDVANTLLITCFIVVCVFWATAYWVLRRMLWHEDVGDILHSIVRYLIASILVLYVLGSGGFLTQHYGFPVAVYAVLFMVFLQHAMQQWGTTSFRWMFATITLIVSVGVLLLPTAHIAPALQQRIATDTAEKQYAEMIDGLMDKCGYERYLIVDGANVPFQHIKHSPFGPGFHRIEFTVPVRWRPAPIPYLLEEYQANVERAEFAIAPATFSESIPDTLARYLSEHFTRDVPTCADGAEPKESQRFLFRKG